MSDLGQTLRFLRGRGFKRVATRPRVRSFDGSLRVSAGEVPIRLSITDWDFLDYPQIELREKPAFLPSPMPHIDATGGLCYLARGSVVLDRYEPASAIALCLEQAEKLLESLIKDPERRGEDIRDEFLAYWSGGARQSYALIGKMDAKVTIAQCSMVKLPPDRLEGSRLTVITADESEIRRLAGSLSGSIIPSQLSRCWILETSLRPAAPEGPLPNTVSEVFKYLKYWDKALHRTLQRMLGSDKEYLAFTRIRVAIRTPAGWLGFSFDLDATYSKGFRRKPDKFRHYLHTKGGNTPITRLILSEFGTDFLHSRNVETPTLAGKRVHLIGCGSVGGYLAQSLARLGAGSLAGVLKLVDPEVLEPDNVGRHWLGMSSLYLNKAVGVAAELTRQFPDSVFESVAADVRDLRGILDCDLVVDATGIEGLSEVLNALHCQKPAAKRPPLLFTWVVGNGEVVQGLMVDKPKYACYRCLRQPKGSQYRLERFPVLNDEPRLRSDGCSHFRPYAVSAPMKAAALATEIIGDWLAGDPSPRFRTEAREGANVREQKNQDVSPAKGCPACGF